MGMEYGFQIIEIQTAIDMKGNIAMIRRADSAYTSGKMEQHTKESFSMT
jgi:hypothetical protein